MMSGMFGLQRQCSIRRDVEKVGYWCPDQKRYFRKWSRRCHRRTSRLGKDPRNLLA